MALERGESVLHEVVVAGGWLVEPVDVALAEPAFLLEVGLDAAEVLGHHGVIGGVRGGDAGDGGFDARVEGSAAEACDTDHEGVEVVVAESLFHGGVPLGPVEDGHRGGRILLDALPRDAPRREGGGVVGGDVVRREKGEVFVQ